MTGGPEPAHPADVGGLYTMLVSLKNDIKDQAIANVRFENSLTQLQRVVEENGKVVDMLSRIIREGNGKQSLMMRVELMENALTRGNAGLEELKKMLESNRSDDSRGRWTLANTIVAGILGFLALIATQFLTQLIGKLKAP